MELGKLAIYHGMEQSYYSSHLVGMKTLKELKDNLDISTNGLNTSELSALDEVKQRFVITSIECEIRHNRVDVMLKNFVTLTCKLI